VLPICISIPWPPKTLYGQAGGMLCCLPAAGLDLEPHIGVGEGEVARTDGI